MEENNLVGENEKSETKVKGSNLNKREKCTHAYIHTYTFITTIQ
jgi:hypothetical protein